MARGADQGRPRPSIEEALAVLRDAVDSPRAQAALKTLEGEVEHASARPESQRPAPQDDKASAASPGKRSAAAAAKDTGGGDAAAADSAKGQEDDSNLPPYIKRQRRKSRQAAKGPVTAQRGA